MDFFEGANDDIKKMKEQASPDPVIVEEDRMPTHLESAKGLILQTLDDFGSMKDAAVKMEVTNEEQSKTAMEMILQSKRILNALEAQRKKILRPYLDFQQEVNAFAREYQTILQEIFDDLSKKRTTYERKIEDERMKAERERIKAEQKLIEDQQKKATEALKEGKMPEPVAPPVPAPLPPPPPKIKEACEDGVAIKKTSWKWEVTDEALIPREYLVLDEVMVNQQVKGGERKIPGIKIFEHTETTYRAKATKKRK